MSESYTAQAILTAKDKNFTSVFEQALGTAGRLENSFRGGLGMGIAMGIGQKLFGMLSHGISGIVGGTIAAGSGLDAAMKQVQATMRVTEGSMDDLNGTQVNIMDTLRAKAQELGKTTQFSAVQVAQAMNNMAMAGYDVQKIYDNIPTVLNLAAAGGLSLDYATQLVANGMAVMGDRCESAAQMADMLAITASSAYGSVAEFGEGLLVAGGQAKLCGLDLAETYTALGILGDAGMQGSEGGTALRNTLKNLYTPTDKAKKVLDQLGVATVDAEGNMIPLQNVLQQLNGALDGMSAGEKTQIMADIFDTRSIRAGNALLEQSGQRFTELHDKIAACDGAAMEMANTVNDNLQGDMIKFQSATEGLQNAIYKSLDGPLRMAVQVGTKGIGLLTDAAEYLGEKFEQIKPYIDAIGDAFTNVLGNSAALRDIVSAVKGLFGVTEEGGTALEQAFDNLAKNKKLEEFRKDMGRLASTVNKFFTDNKDQIIAFINMLPTIAQGLIGLKIAGSVAGPLTKLGGALSGIIGMAGSVSGGFLSMAKGTGEFVAGFGHGFAEGITGVFKTSDALETLRTRASLTGTKIKVVGKGMWKGWTGGLAAKFPKLTGALGAFGKVAGTAGVVASKAFGKAGEGLIKLSGLALKAIAPGAMIGVVLAGLGLVYNAFGDQIDQILLMAQEKGPEIITGLANGIAEKIPELVASGATLVEGLLNTLTANLPAIIAGGSNIIMALVNGVASALPTLIPTAAMAVMTLVSGLVQQIPNLIVTGLNLLQGLAQGIANALPFIMQSGIQTIIGFIQGIAQNLPTIIATGIQIISTLASGLLAALGELIKAIPDIFGSLVDAILSVDWLGVGGQILEAIKNGIVGGVSWLGDTIKGLFDGEEDTAQSSGRGMGDSYMAGAQSQIDSSPLDASGVFASFDTEALTAGATLETNMGDMLSTIDMTGADMGTSMQGTWDQMNATMQSGGNKSMSIAQGTASGIVTRFNGAQNGAYNAGQNISRGLANGLSSMEGRVWSAAESIANAAEKAIRAAAQVHSPSRVSTRLGEYWGEGFVNGIASMVREASEASQSLVSIPRLPSFSAQAVGGYGELSSYGANQTIIVPVVIDGREVARVTAPYNEEYQNRRTRNANRKKGVA